MPRKIRSPRLSKRTFSKLVNRLKTWLKNLYIRIASTFRKRPLISFCATLCILLIFIIIANILGTPRSQNISQPSPITVSVYRIGAAPKVSLPAKIEKAGVIKIIAQTAGIAQSIPVTEGISVKKGTTLINLSTNYQGGDIAGIQVQIAQAQYNNTIDTFSTQQDLIEKQRKAAEQSSQNTENLRQIALLSQNDTQVLVNNNGDVLNTITQNLTNYIATDSGGINDQLIFQTKQLANQLQAGQNQLVNALRQSQYQTNTANPPTILNDLQKDITLRQIDIQEKALNLGKEISTLQLHLALLSESLMHPASPVNGRVERIYVSVGQAVNPGEPLAVISAENTSLDVTAVVSVPNQVAHALSRIESSILHIGNKEFSTTPRYVSQEATNGNLYTVLYSIPQEYQSALTNAGFITVDIPVGVPDTGKTIPFVPLDSIYQTQDTAYVYVAKNGKVESKEVTLGTVYGRFVEITSGLTSGDQVILERNVVAGDRVKIQ